MPTSTLTILIASLAIVFLTMVLMLVLMHRSQVKLMSRLLRLQVVENQSLRNQLRASDLGTLAGLNEATLPSSNKSEYESLNFAETIDYEENLIQNGYSLGDLSDELTAAGWTPTVINRESGRPVES